MGYVVYVCELSHGLTGTFLRSLLSYIRPTTR
jgi:hypothetical protein